MTNTEKLLQAGWTKTRRTDECGQAIVTRGNLEGLACIKSAVWARGSLTLCAQHALLEPATEIEPGTLAEGAKVEQLANGANAGALGRVTRIVAPQNLYSDGSAADGEIQVTFPGIRFPVVTYRYGSWERFVKLV